MTDFTTATGADIVEFTKARLRAEFAAVDKYGTDSRYRRMLKAIDTIAEASAAQIAATGRPIVDNPLAAGLLVIANIWAEHQDFKPAEWFPTMIQPIQETDS